MNVTLVPIEFGVNVAVEPAVGPFIEWETYLECLIEDTELRVAMGQSRRKRMEQYYNLENELKTLRSWLYEELSKNLKQSRWN